LAEASGIGLENQTDLIPHPAESGKNLVLGTHRMSGITETPVVTPDLAGKHRANLIGVTADSDDRINRTIQKLLEMLRMMTAQVDAYFAHDFDGFRVDISGRF
jgi:hypothetical protein